jgi:thiol-disulfide isomerase/thioredoxin
MDSEKKKKLKSTIINYVFYALLLIILISTNAKSWLLRGVLSTGLFSPKIEQKATKNLSAMPLTFNDQNNLTKSTENLTGKVVFINFWASWCPPCRAEMPSMNKMYQRLKNDPAFEFIFINLDDENSKGMKYLHENGFQIPFQKAVGFIPTDLYTGTLPTTVVLDKEGVVVMNHSGMGDYNSGKFIKQLESLK